MAIHGDLYANFAYCKSTGPVAAGDTTIVVDDISRLPTILQSGVDLGDAIPAFWMTFDSALGATNTFEIVRVTNVDAATKTLTVNRGQEGTTAVAHDAGTYLKGTLTAGMARRAAGADLVSTLSPPALGAGGASGHLSLLTNNATAPQFLVPYTWAEWDDGSGPTGSWFALDGWAPTAACGMAWDTSSTDPLIVIHVNTLDGLGEYVTNGSLGGGNKYMLGLPPSAGVPGGSPNLAQSINQVYAGDPQVATDVSVLTSSGRCWVAVRYLLTLTGLAEGDIVAFATNELSQSQVTQTVLDVTKADDGSYSVGGIAVLQAGAAFSYGPQIALKTTATDVAVTRMYLYFHLLAGNPLV